MCLLTGDVQLISLSDVANISLLLSSYSYVHCLSFLKARQVTVFRRGPKLSHQTRDSVATVSFI